MKISLIQPSRNNLKYLKWSYDSIRKNQGDHTVQICVADDASTDGTWDWCQKMVKQDKDFKAIRNDGPDRLGHTILYDRLINEVADHDVCMIYHADMYLMPGAIDSIENTLKEKTIVSLTRIEPPLHPPGPEKILRNYGVEPEEFDEVALLKWFETVDYGDKLGPGIFAPWAFWKKDFQEIGGHDPLYAPQPKEDSDIFNRFKMNGIKFRQTWAGFVYHMTCRGSRRNTVDKAKNIYEDSPEWLAQNMRSHRNFIRKWGQAVEHTSDLEPIITPKFDIGIKIKNCNNDILWNVEPWCSDIFVDCDVKAYVSENQTQTSYDLAAKVHDIDAESTNDILVTFDARQLTEHTFRYITQLPKIFSANPTGAGEFKTDCLTIKVNALNHYHKELIKCDTTS